MNKLFIYGTLKRGCKNNLVMGTDEAHAKFIREYVTKPQFTLLHLGGFPGLIHQGNQMVTGEIWEVSDQLLKRLDIFEGHPNLFKRTDLEAEHEPIWYYAWNGSTSRDQIRGGVWKDDKNYY